MICTIIGGGEGVNKVDSFIGFKIGLNYSYKYHDTDINVMYDNPARLSDLNPPNLHTLKHWEGDVLYNNVGRQINYNKGEVGCFNASVIMAVNVAIHLGYTEIYLVGCENRINEKTHFYTKSKASTKELDKYNKAFEIIAKMWDEVEPQKGERLIFVDSDITKFENITIDEYKQKALLSK